MSMVSRSGLLVVLGFLLTTSYVKSQGCGTWYAGQKVRSSDFYVFAAPSSFPGGYTPSFNFKLFTQSTSAVSVQIISWSSGAVPDIANPVFINNLTQSAPYYHTVTTNLDKVYTFSSVSGATFTVYAEVFLRSTQNEISAYAMWLAPVTTADTEYLVNAPYVSTTPTSQTIIIVSTKFPNSVTVTLRRNMTNSDSLQVGYGGQTYTNGRSFTLAKMKTWEKWVITPTIGDLTGSSIKADYPVLVFAGNMKQTFAVNDAARVDAVFDQLFPVGAWGNEFVTIVPPQLKQGNSVRLKVVTNHDNNVLTVAGVTYALAKRGDFVEVALAFTSDNTKKGIYARANLAVLTVQIIGSLSEFLYQPATFVLQSVSQWTNFYQFRVDYVNATAVVVANMIQTGDIRHNGNSLTAEGAVFYSTPGSSYVSTNMQLSVGVHTFTSNAFLPVKFGLWLYQTDGNIPTTSTASNKWFGIGYSAGYELNTAQKCDKCTSVAYCDLLDNDCDRAVDEEIPDGIDNDNDGLIDEDTKKSEFVPCTDSGLSGLTLPLAIGGFIIVGAIVIALMAAFNRSAGVTI